MKQRQILKTAVAADLPLPFSPAHGAPGDAMSGPEQGLQAETFAQCYGDPSLICPAWVPRPSYSYRTPNSSSSCAWEGTRLMLLPAADLLPSRQAWLHSSGRHVLLEALPGSFNFCFLVCFLCRPSSKLSSRSSQGVQPPIQKHPGFGCHLCAV